MVTDDPLLPSLRSPPAKPPKGKGRLLRPRLRERRLVRTPRSATGRQEVPPLPNPLNWSLTMKILDQLKSLATALTGARSDLTRLDRRLADLASERARIEKIPPHTTDLVNWLEHGLAEYETQFKVRLSWFLNPESLAAVSGSYFSTAGGFALASLPALKPSYLTPSPGTIGERSNSTDPAVFMWALSELIKPKLPQLVAELVPGSAKGLRWADRSLQLGKLDEEVAALTEQRAALVVEIQAAARAAAPALEAGAEQPEPARDVITQSGRRVFKIGGDDRGQSYDESRGHRVHRVGGDN
jgi:hypothetical protein